VQARATWQTDPSGVGGLGPERLVFLDEAAVLTNMVRRAGRSPRGQRVRAKVPLGGWKRLSLLGAIAIDGFIAAMSVEAATDSATFAADLEQVLLPALRRRKPDAVLVMDNLPPSAGLPSATPMEPFGQLRPQDARGANRA
jgi:DDE superfamily endonuclease